MSNVKQAPSNKGTNGSKSTSEEEKPSIFHNAAPGERPATDAGYFELLSFSLLASAVGNKQELTANWPHILYGFKNFHVQRVSEFDETDIRELVERAPVLRDKPQLQAVIKNAEAMIQISQVYGSFLKYLRSFEQDGPKELFKDMGERFIQIDDSIARDFLKNAGTGIKFPEPPRPAKPGKQPRRRNNQGSGRQQRNGNQKPAGRASNGRSNRQPGRGPRQETSAQNGQKKDGGQSKRQSRRRFWKKKRGAGGKKPEAAGTA